MGTDNQPWTEGRTGAGPRPGQDPWGRCWDLLVMPAGAAGRDMATLWAGSLREAGGTESSLSKCVWPIRYF